MRNSLYEEILFIPTHLVQDVRHSVKIVVYVRVEYVTWSACADEQADLSMYFGRVIGSVFIVNTQSFN